jgi:hypothetical protein
VSWKPTLPRLLTGTVLASAAACAFLAATPWLRAYQVAHAPLLLALAAALPVIISAVAARLLQSSVLVSYAVSGTGLLTLLAISNGGHFPGIWDGLVHVPAQLLTETLPLSGGVSLLTAPIVLTWLYGAASAELLVRPARPTALAMAVPVAGFALAFVATTSGPTGQTLPEGAALLGALVVWALARQGRLETEAARAGTARGGPAEPARRLSSLRRATAGAAMAAGLVVALATGISNIPALAAKPATVSRPTQLLSGTVVDPLDALASLRNSAPRAAARALFSVEVPERWSGYVPVAMLDQYDGGTWTFSSATFRPTGGRVPSPATLAASEPEAQPLLQRYTLESAIGLPFLPALDRPEQVEGMAVDADAATGMLAASPPLPASYSVISRVPPSTVAGLSPVSALASGTEVPGGATPTDTALPAGSAPDVAAAVRFAVNLTGRPAAPTLAFLQSLSAALRDQERRVSPQLSSGEQSAPAALAGTSLAQVMNAVTVDRVATPEQFATFVAVVGRYLGVPIRVGTGFRVPAAGRSAGPVPPGRYQLTNRDAWTWDEVPVLGYGWVVVDATPVPVTADLSAPPEPVTPTPTTVPKQVTALPGRGAAHAIAKPVDVRLAQPLHIDWLALLGAGLPAALVIALLAGGLGLPALRRGLRRRARRRTDDPALMTAGAWLELIDGLFRLGVPVDGSATTTDVAAQVASRFGDDFGPPTKVLATLADQALYSSKWPVDEAGARRAWDTQRQLYGALWSSVGQRDKARALLLVGMSPVRAGSGRAGGAP